MKKKSTPTKASRKPQTPTEYVMQRHCVDYLKSEHPLLVFTATVGGAHLTRGPIGFAKLRASGYLNGIPDLLIFEPRGKFHGLFIELKLPGRPLRVEQASVHARLIDRGYRTETCYSFDEFKAVICAYLACDDAATQEPSYE